MNRHFRSTRKFDKQFNNLDSIIKKQVLKAIELYMHDPAHPSLRFKKVQGTDNFFEISVNMSVRIITEIESDNNNELHNLYIIGKHEEVFPPK